MTTETAATASSALFCIWAANIACRRRPAIALLQDAMPCPGLPLVHFNDHRCGSIGELRSVILKARRLAHDDAERERAAAAVKTWLLAQIEQKQAADGGRTISPPSGSPPSSRPGPLRSRASVARAAGEQRASAVSGTTIRV